MTQSNADDRAAHRRTILAAAADLLFASRIRAAAAQEGVDVVLVRSGDELKHEARARRPDLLVVDLDARWLSATDVIRRLRADPETAGLRIVAFAAHVHKDALEDARTAGADRVLARSAFVRELGSLLRG